MPRIASKKTKQYRMIEDAVSVGMSANKIQKFLRDNDMGARRKTLLAEIRSIKEKGLNKEQRKVVREKYEKRRKKYTKEKPEKIRKRKWKERALKIGQIYRGSLIISSVPLHSTPFNRKYLGFRLNVFSYDRKEVSSALRSMKKEFIRMVGNRLKSGAYAEEQTLGTEPPTKINVSNPNYRNGKWFFAVEEQGKDIGSESGYI